LACMHGFALGACMPNISLVRGSRTMHRSCMLTAAELLIDSRAEFGAVRQLTVRVLFRLTQIMMIML
jgi:hypothetical protein